MTGHFVGRTRELRLLENALGATHHGRGLLAVVAGESGIGKTRLCGQVASRAEHSGVRVIWETCWPESGAPPLWPWQPVLEAMGAAPSLCHDDPSPPERFTHFAAVAEQVSQACDRRPTLVVIDDVHTAGPDAISLTRFLARHLARLPLVILLARRLGTAETTSTPLRELEGAATVLTLPPFNPAETAAFLHSYGYLDVEADLQQALFRLTGGNPSRLKRLIALGPADRAPGRIPRDDVKAAVLQAVDRLDTDARRVLGRVAVLGPSPLTVEAAPVADCTRADLAVALNRAERVGLVTVEGRERFTFTHELVRECLRDRLTRAERSDAHARAADTINRQQATADARQLARVAEHAVRAAARSPEDARRAITACRTTATVLMRSFSYEQAAATLEAAMGVHEQAGLPGHASALLAEWALAMQSYGRPAEARKLFDRAAVGALTDGEPVELARAALGLGGVWVSEHRTRAERERTVGLQRRALADLPAGERSLRCRLTVRLAAEEVCQGAPVEPLFESVEEARELGDDGVLAEALSLCHHALLRPRFAQTRLALAEELIAVASPTGAGMLARMGLLWRTVDLFQLGDLRAAHALVELRAHAEAQNCGSVLYVAQVLETMLLIRAGRLEEAEAKAGECLQLGIAVGDADAFGYFGSQLTTIRWLQDRGEEMLAMIEELTTSPTLAPAEFASQATVAYLAAGAGQHDKARLVLDKVTAPGLASLPESSTWLGGMCAIVKAAHDLGHADLARQAYQVLLPYADLPIMPMLAVTCLGSVERVLGLAAATFGQADLAVEHLDRAVTANRLLGSLPMTAVTLADLAEVLLRRAGPGDREEAIRLLTEAIHEAETLGLARRAARWRERLQKLDLGRGTVRRQGRHWLFALDGREAIVSDRLGLTYLARLLANPGQAIPALDLAAHTTPPASAYSHQPVVDDQAKAAYRRRAGELAEELIEAERNADLARAELLRVDLDALAEELDRVGAKGGRTRAFPGPQERARTAVRKAIKRAIDEIAAVDPGIGGVLRSTITTGSTCCYTPDPAQPVTWTLRPQ